MKKFYTSLLLTFSTIIAIAQFPASFDSSFDGDGRMTYPVAVYSLPQVKSKHLLQPDGKIIFCANKDLGNGNYEIVVARSFSDGSPDTTFADHGIFSYPIVTGYTLAVGLELQPDGKIVTSGICNDGNTSINNQVFILRLNSNGAFDSTFGTNGFSIWNFSDGDERVTDMKRMADGSFAITGFVISFAGSDSAFILKVKPNGLADSSFATDGFFRYQHNGNQTDAYAVEVMPDNSIMTAGSTYTSGGTYLNSIIIKVNSAGALFSGFGNNGVFVKDILSDDDEIHALKRLPDGNILAAGYAFDDVNTYNDGGYIMKLDSTGKIIGSFGTNGITFFSTSGSGNRIYGMDVQINGKIVLAGYHFNFTSFNNDAMVLRLLANGKPDTSFNNSEAAVYIDWAGDYDNSSSVLIQPDGKILLYGTAILNITTQQESPVFARLSGGERGSTLPLQLLHFGGVAAEKAISLKWITSQEINTGYFIVERSINGAVFKDIAKVKAHNTMQTGEYNYTDQDLKTGKTYYRLRITDKDGTQSFSETIFFNCSKENVRVYPAITRSGITIQTDSKALFNLYNSYGQLVRTLTPGTNDLSNERAGVYYIRTSDSVISIIKQ